MKLLTFLTDFGSNSNYVSQMKGVALSITDARIEDISHDVSQYNIREGAYILKTSVLYFPVGTVHVAVVDPGVGTSRRGIVVTTQSQILVGPDNGLLIPAAKLLGNFTVYEIKNQDLYLKNISNTFHGRDIFTPVASHILNGVLFDQIGPIIHDYIDLDFGKYEIKSKSANGRIIYIDGFGNIVTNINGIRLSQILSFNKEIMVILGEKQLKIPFVKSYNFVKKNNILSTIGSGNLFEIAKNQGNAAKQLKVNIDDKIKILF
jgi:S-adenosylmethionine hydrolase